MSCTWIIAAILTIAYCYRFAPTFDLIAGCVVWMTSRFTCHDEGAFLSCQIRRIELCVEVDIELSDWRPEAILAWANERRIIFLREMSPNPVGNRAISVEVACIQREGDWPEPRPKRTGPNAYAWNENVQIPLRDTVGSWDH
jgi:hypothetical protein